MALQKQAVLDQTQLADVLVDLQLVQLEVVAVETRRSQEDVHLVEEQRVVHGDGQLNVALVAGTEFFVEATCGTQVSEESAQRQVVQTVADGMAQIVKNNGVGDLLSRQLSDFVAG